MRKMSDKPAWRFRLIREDFKSEVGWQRIMRHFFWKKEHPTSSWLPMFLKMERLIMKTLKNCRSNWKRTSCSWLKLSKKRWRLLYRYRSLAEVYWCKTYRKCIIWTCRVLWWISCTCSRCRGKNRWNRRRYRRLTWQLGWNPGNLRRRSKLLWRFKKIERTWEK